MTATLIKPEPTPVANDPWATILPPSRREPVGCADCGAPADAPCDIACTSAADLWLEDVLEQEANFEAPCHASPYVAAQALCGCW